MSYDKLNYPDPESLEGNNIGCRALIIGSGPSTETILKYKNQFKNKFDVIMVLNYSFKFFDDVIDYHLVTEKSSKSSMNMIPSWLKENDYNKNIPRLINWKGIEQYPQNLNLYKLQRCKFDSDTFNSKKYRNGENIGLMVGPVSYKGFSIGSSTLCAMHFSSMLGASEIYLIGADFFFRDEYDHWYKDRIYRDPPSGSKVKNHHDIVEVNHGGKTYQSTAFFRDSATYIDSIIPTIFKDIKVYDFSDGLLNTPINVDVDKFFST